jgi:hypothetical protein
VTGPRRGGSPGGVALGYLGTIVSGFSSLTTDAGGDSTAASFLLVGSPSRLRGADLPACTSAPRGQQFRMIDALRSWSQLRATIGHRQRRRACCDSSSVALQRPGQHGHRGDERFATQAIGFTSSRR